MMCSRQVTRLLLRSASVTKDSALAASCDELTQLAESDARREEAQHRERHHAALIAAIVCRIWQGRTRIGPSVRQRPPFFSNITETGAWRDFRCRAKEGAETLPSTTACTVDSTQGGASQWVHVPWGNCASPSSVAEGMRCSACSTYYVQ